MTNQKKLLFFLLFSAFLGISFFMPDIVAADHTTAHIIQQLQEQIEQLQARIKVLQQQAVSETPIESKPVPTTVYLPQPTYPSVPECPVFSGTLYPGARDGNTDGEVTRLQKMLAQDSTVYPEGLITGYYGLLTEKAVQRWQAKNGIVSVGSPATTGYGVVGPQTQARMTIGCRPPVHKPLLRVSSPNGGEIWLKGTMQTITWRDGTPAPLCPGGTLCRPSAPKSYDITLIPYYSPCKGPVCPAFAVMPYTIAKNTQSSVYEWPMYEWSVGKVLETFGKSDIVSDGLYTIEVCRTNSAVCDSSDSYFKIASENTGEKILKRIGEQEGSFLIQKINPNSVDGLWYQAYPVPTGEGTPKTLYIGDDIGYACEGVSEKLTSIDFSGQTITFTKIISASPPVACPICLAGDTFIDTPLGKTTVKDLQIGAPVWTTDKAGNRIAGVVVKTSRVPVPPTHTMVHLVLDDGRELFVSPGHPTIDGRTVKDLLVNDFYDGAHVITVDRVAYGDGATYDILSSGATGFYWANGILLDSTLHQ